MNADLDQSVLLFHLAATLFMTGSIWFVQIVHYPLMDAVGPENYTEYHRRHQNLTSYVVGPVMLFELTTAIALLYLGWQSSVSNWALSNLVLLGVIWASTFLVQVPCHERLAKGFSREAHRRLVNTNWIRTVAWTSR
ncbi:MAG TPA: hypothetical protein DEP46_19185, partial [Blastocatellia bacterium]|nr:hypothetical protein [Blastocatellia bacterium]